MAKILFDRVFALILLLCLAPVFMCVALCIWCFIGTPVIFKQKRPGKDGKIFTIYKFRTMSDARGGDGALLDDALRLGKVGRLIRATSLDELPQLLNVFLGEMSFVGPRPLLVEYLALYNSHQKRRHEVLPGITGWAQVNGRNAISWEQKFALDVWYVEHQSFWLDMKILYLTLLKVLKRSGISAKESATMERFLGTQNPQSEEK